MEKWKSMKSMTKKSISIYSQNTLENLLNLNYNPMKENKGEDIDNLIESKFYCSRKFSEEIENIVKTNKDMKYIDAIVFFCGENNIDVESIPKLMSKPLKEKLKCEAIDLNLLKRTSYGKLPV